MLKKSCILLLSVEHKILSDIHISKLAKLWVRKWNVQDARRLSEI